MADTEFIGVQIHKDVSDYEEKLYSGFTKRQIFGAAVAIAVAGALGVLLIGVLQMPSEYASIAIMVPAAAIVLGISAKVDGLPFEKYWGLALTQMRNAQKLPYKTNEDPLCASFHGMREVPAQVEPTIPAPDAE